MSAPKETFDPSEITSKLTASPEIHVELGAFEAFSLVAQIQLASRHPANHGEPARLARQFAGLLTKQLSAGILGLDRVIEQGWNPPADVTIDDDTTAIVASVVAGGVVVFGGGIAEMPFVRLLIDIPGVDQEVMLPGFVLPDGARVGEDLIVGFKVRACRTCGCSTTRPCALGCEWVDLDLCSRCAPPKLYDGTGKVL